MDGFRVLENGDRRLTESGDGRITERVVLADVSFIATGSYLSLPFRVQFGIISFVASSGITVDGEIAIPGFVSFPASVTASFAPTLMKKGAVTFSAVLSGGFRANSQKPAALELIATGAQFMAAGIPRNTRFDFEGNSGVSFAPRRIRQSAIGFRPSARLVLEPMMENFGAVQFTATAQFKPQGGMVQDGRIDLGAVDYIRITEGGDRRITENGDVRQVSEITSEISFNATLTKFAGSPFTNKNGDWFRLQPFVKASGEWVQPLRAYAFKDGRWNRFY